MNISPIYEREDKKDLIVINMNSNRKIKCICTFCVDVMLQMSLESWTLITIIFFLWTWIESVNIFCKGQECTNLGFDWLYSLCHNYSTMLSHRVLGERNTQSCIPTKLYLWVLKFEFHSTFHMLWNIIILISPKPVLSCGLWKCIQ